MRSSYVICGATGNVGRKIADALLAAGEPVRVIARERVRLGPLAAKGAEPWPGDIEDSAFLAKAFSGVRGAFVMIPPRHDAPELRSYQRRLASSILSALQKARVPRVVALSSVGAHLREGTGPVLGLHDLETRLDQIPDAAVVALRPGYFMENHLWSIPLVRARGINGSTLRADVPIAMVATKDIADEAARLLRSGTLKGHGVRYLLGPADRTLSEATRVLGEALGKPDLAYIQLSRDEARAAMASAGMSPSVVEAMLEMQNGFNEGTIRPTEERGAGNSTPTTLETFAHEVFARAYRAAA
jgi:uncharacterized protein YbjT (DUF2867 family)